MRAGANAIFRVTKGNASSLTILSLNIMRLDPPVVVPALGGPCELLVPPLAILAQNSNTSGNTNFTIPVPNDLTLKGADIYAQAFIDDIFVPWSLKIIATNGFRRSIGVLPQITLVRSTGTVAIPVPASGGVTKNYGMVTMFDWM